MSHGARSRREPGAKYGRYLILSSRKEGMDARADDDFSGFNGGRKLNYY